MSPTSPLARSLSTSRNRAPQTRVVLSTPESQRSSRGRWCYFTMLSFKLRGSFFVTFALVVRAVLALSIPSELILEALDAEREYFGSSLRLPGPEVSGAEDGQARLDVVPVDPTEAFLSSLTEGRSLLNSLHKTGL